MRSLRQVLLSFIQPDIAALETIIREQERAIEMLEAYARVPELLTSVRALCNKSDQLVRQMHLLLLDVGDLLNALPSQGVVTLEVYAERIGESKMEVAVFKITVPEIPAPSVVVSRDVLIQVEGKPDITETLQGLAGKVYENLEAPDAANVAVTVTTVDHHGGRTPNRQTFVIHNTFGPPKSPDVTLDVTGEAAVPDPTPAPAPAPTPEPAPSPSLPAGTGHEPSPSLPAGTGVEPAPSPSLPAGTGTEPSPTPPAGSGA